MDSDHRVVQNAGVNLAVECGGEGSTVVLLHGFACDRSLWDACVASLESRHRVIRYDLRGHGESSSPESRFSVADHVKDLATVLDAFGEFGPVHLVGHSLGSAVATSFCVESPERCESLSLVAPMLAGYRWGTDWIERIQALREAFLRGDLASGLDAHWLSGEHFERSRMHESWDAARSMVMRWKGAPLVEPVCAETAFDEEERIRRILVPVLVMSGAQDHEDLLEVAYLLTTRIPGGSMELFEDCGHLLPLESPERFLPVLLQFLEDGGAEY